MARPRAQDYDDKRDAILDRAAELFAVAGFAATSIQDIARAGGVSKALLYHYYESKEALLFDILNRHIRMLLESVEAVAGQAEPTDPEARLRRLVSELMAGYEAANDEHRVLLNELPALPADQQQAIRDMERQIVRLFATAIRAVNPQLADQPALTMPVTMSLLGMLNWHYTWFRANGPMSREAYADLATSLFLNGARSLP